MVLLMQLQPLHLVALREKTTEWPQESFVRMLRSASCIWQRFAAPPQFELLEGLLDDTALRSIILLEPLSSPHSLPWAAEVLILLSMSELRACSNLFNLEIQHFVMFRWLTA